ncbi:MAG TPA: hypothetical protein VHN77_04165 [Phycisphaerales bacterium]|nr:hypothetical protein [Phycisphaerales bacterium]
MKRHEHSMPRGTPSGDGPTVSIEDAVNLAMDLEAAGDAEHARAVLREAAARFPEALARVAALRAATNELRAPVAHADLTSRVLDQWEREELLESAPQHTDVETGPLELAPVPQDWSTPRAAVAASSQPRHRRARGRSKVGGRWTVLAACAFGVALSIALYVTNERGAPPAPGPATVHAPHLLGDAAPVVVRPASPGAPLRLGNAGSYDHVPIDTTLTARAARLRYDAQPADTWVFAGLQAHGPGPAAAPARSVLVPFAGLFGNEGGVDEAANGPLDPSLARVRLRLVPPVAADE